MKIYCKKNLNKKQFKLRQKFYYVGEKNCVGASPFINLPETGVMKKWEIKLDGHKTQK